MGKRIWLLALCCAALVARASDPLEIMPGAVGEFGAWSKNIAAHKIPAQLISGGGIDKSNALKVDLSQYGFVSVDGLKLQAGKRYSLGGWVKTKNFRCRIGAFVLHNRHWRKDLRTRSFLVDTNEKWIKIEYTGVLPESVDGKYSFGIYANKVEAGSKLEFSSPFVTEVKSPDTPATSCPVKPGENLLPGFGRNFDGEIGLWSRNLNLVEGAVTKLPGDGLDGADALRLNCSESHGLKLGELKFVPGEKYRFGAYVRTDRFKNNGSSILIYNYKWNADIRSGIIPQNTHGKWVKIETEAVMPTSGNGCYSFLIYAPDGGKLDVCRPFVYGISARAAAESKPSDSYLSQIRRLIPVSPLLNRIEAASPRLTFTYVCPMPGRESDLQLRMRVASGKELKWSQWRTFTVPQDRRISTSWASVPAGKGKIQVELVKKSGGTPELSNEYAVEFQAPLPPFREKRLNNLVTELSRQPLKNGKVSFVNPREGWIYIGLSDNDPSARVSLNGMPEAVKPRPGERSETMRYLPRGKHELTVSGVVAKNNQLIIRTVPEIMLFPLDGIFDKGAALSSYDLAFTRKHLFPNANLFFMLFGWNPKNDFQRMVGREVAERGIRIMGSDGFFAHEWMNRDQMRLGLLENYPTMTTAGRAVDETDTRAEAQLLNNYAEIGWEFADYDKFIYLWLAATKSFFNYPALHTPLIAGASNIGQGRGKLLMETYVETTPDLASLKKYYELVPRHMRAAKSCVPDAQERMMLVMSGLVTAGVWDCNSYPQSDIKYAYDYFFHLVSTVPEARGLYGVGCYNIRWADEEMLRWIAKLLRHYAVEGNTEMLSGRYDIKYNPGHVVNGDFQSGLDGWQVFPAEPGSIGAKIVPGYGFSQQRRRGLGHRNGDTTAEFIRSAKGPNRITQILKNFQPGELYSLTFVTADPIAIEEHKKERAVFAFEAKLTGAEILPELGYEFRNPGAGNPLERTEIVTRKIVFRALKPEIGLEFSDWRRPTEAAAPIGGRRILNFVNVNKYWVDKVE